MMLKHTFPFILLLILSLLSCEKIKLGDPFSCRIGDKFRVDVNLSFSVDSVNDFRCPLQFECFWSGDAKVFVTICKPMSKIDTSIYLFNRDRNPVFEDGYSFKILSVDPQSQRGEQIPQKDYEIKMIVEKD